MQNGVHVIERALLTRLETQKGFKVPTPWLGMVDLGRMIEGLLPEPEPQVPIGVIGLDELLWADAQKQAAQIEDMLRRLRASLHDGKSYFAWKEIPLVFLVHGALEALPDDGGLGLTVPGQAGPVALAPLLGRQLAPVGEDTRGWWWSPQPG